MKADIYFCLITRLVKINIKLNSVMWNKHAAVKEKQYKQIIGFYFSKF